MYRFDLSESYVPAQCDQPVLETTVGGLLGDMAAKYSGAEAMVEITRGGQSARRWSFDQLLADSERLALAFASRFRKGERVVIWAPNMPEWVLVQYASALSGLVLVTANPAYQPSELRYVLEQSGAVGLFVVDEYRSNPMVEIAARACAGNANIREVINLRDHDALFRLSGEVLDLPEVLPGDPVQIQYTSGTTGFPKGTILTHRGLTNNARFYGARAGAAPGAVWPVFMPLFHAAGCVSGVLGALQFGVKLLIFNVFDPVSVLKQVEAEGVNALIGVPTMLIALMEAQNEVRAHISSIGITMSGGAIVAPDLVQRVKDVFGCDFTTVYALTESSPVIAQHFPDDRIDDVLNSVGQPLPQTEISIRSLADNKVVQLGQIGEICTRGYLVMQGYNDNPEATAAAIDEGGWLHTGDLGSLDGRGYLRISGRVKEMIIRGGENLFPAEIENALLEHPDVAEVAVVGLPDAKWGEIVACFVRPEVGCEIDKAQLRLHCRSLLAAQKTPAVWVEVAGFPQTGSGKIRKFALREEFEAGKHSPL